MKDEVINFYTVDKIKKYLPKINDEQEEYTGMKLFNHILICGGTGAGKSNCVMNYIKRVSEGNGTYKHIYICYKTPGEPFYQFLEHNLKKEEVSFYKSVNDFPNVEDFSDQINEKPIKGMKKEKDKEKDKYLVIFDDCVNDKDKKALSKIEKYFTYARKKFITLMFLTQSYFDTSTFIRKQVSYVILCSIRGLRDLNLICKDFSFGIDSQDLMKLYKEATTKSNDYDMPFFKINTMECPLNKKFSRNFLGYFEIDNEGSKDNNIKIGGGAAASTLNQDDLPVRDIIDNAKREFNNIRGEFNRHNKQIKKLIRDIRLYNHQIDNNTDYINLKNQYNIIKDQYRQLKESYFFTDNSLPPDRELQVVIHNFNSYKENLIKIYGALRQLALDNHLHITEGRLTRDNSQESIQDINQPQEEILRIPEATGGKISKLSKKKL